MSCCIDITLRELPLNTPAQYVENERLSIDFDADLQITEQAHELNDAGSIKESGIKGVSIPGTQKNRFALSTVMGENGYSYAPLPVRIIAAGHYELEETVLAVKQEKQCGGFEVDLLNGEASFIEAAKNLELCDIEGFPPFLFGNSHIRNIQIFHQEYSGNGLELGYWFPLIDYGNFWNEWATSVGHQVVAMTNYRVWPHISALLEKGFAQLGFSFHCEFLKTDQGKRIISYLANNLSAYKSPDAVPLKYPLLSESAQARVFPDYILGESTTLPCCNMYRFSAEKTTDQVLLTAPPAGGDVQVIKFTSETEDTAEGLSWNTASGPGSGFWRQGAILSGIQGTWSIKGRLYIKSPTATVFDLAFAAGLYDPLNSEASIWVLTGTIGSFFSRSNVLFLPHPGNNEIVSYDFDLIYTGAWVNQGDEHFLFIRNGIVSGFTVMAGSYIKGTGQTVVPTFAIQNVAFPPIFYQETRVVVFPQSYFGDWSLYDLLTGFLHLIEGKIDYDPVMKRIYAMPSEKSDWAGTKLEGYYRDDIAKDISGDEVCCETTFASTPSPPLCKSMLGFKSASDAYIKTKSSANRETQLYDKVIISDQKNCKGTKQYRNPFFEPSLERLQTEIRTLLPLGLISIPALWDNDGHNTSYNIGPRIAVALGYGEQSQFNSTTTRAFREYTTAEFDVFDVAYASQSQAIPFQSLPLGQSTSVRPDWDLIYGGNDNELYLFWKRKVDGSADKYVFQAKIRVGSLYEFRRLNFRDLYYMFWKGRKIPVRLTKKSGYKICKDKTLNIEVIPNG